MKFKSPDETIQASRASLDSGLLWQRNPMSKSCIGDEIAGMMKPEKLCILTLRRHSTHHRGRRRENGRSYV